MHIPTPHGQPFDGTPASRAFTSGVPSLDTAFEVTIDRINLETQLLAHFRKRGLEPTLEWNGSSLVVHSYAESTDATPAIDIASLSGEPEAPFKVTVRYYTPDPESEEQKETEQRGLSYGSQAIRSLRTQLSNRYGRHRNWRVSEDYATKNLVLFYSGSLLRESEEASVRQIIQKTTDLPVRIERRLNQTALARKILESKPEGIAASHPAFFDEKFAVITIPKYAPGTPEFREVRRWQAQLQKIGRQFGVGVIVRPNGVGNAFFRFLTRRNEENGGGLLRNASLVKDVRDHFFPRPPLPHDARPEAKVSVDLPFVSIDPLGSDNMPFPGDTLRSQSDPEDLVWAGRRPDGGYRFVAAICDVTRFLEPKGAMLGHIQHFGQSFYSPLESYPLLGKELAFRDACFQEKVPSEAFIIDLSVSWDGTIESATVYEGIAESSAQLSYDKVEQVFQGKATHETAPVLDVLRDFSQARRIHRRAQSPFSYEQPTSRSGSSYENESGIVIEEAMLAAKATIGKLFEEHGVPAIHRVYGPPTTAQQKRLMEKLEKLNIAASSSDLLDERRVVAILLELQDLEQSTTESSRHECRALMNDLFTSLQFGASYSAVAKGHAGLALPYYAPIKGREGAGVINQFVLKAFLRNEESPYNSAELPRLARAFARSENFYAGRLHGLIYMQALERGLALAEQNSFTAIWDPTKNGFVVAGFDGQIATALQEFPGLAEDLKSEVVTSRSPADSKVIPVHFEGYDIEKRSFLFSAD